CIFPALPAPRTIAGTGNDAAELSTAPHAIAGVSCRRPPRLGTPGPEPKLATANQEVGRSRTVTKRFETVIDKVAKSTRRQEMTGTGSMGDELAVRVCVGHEVARSRHIGQTDGSLRRGQHDHGVVQDGWGSVQFLVRGHRRTVARPDPAHLRRDDLDGGAL